MRSSIPLYDALAADYDDHFAVPHRRAYDELSWDLVVDVLAPPESDRPVIDAGCGVGRWAQRLVGMGHNVVGLEQAPLMAEAARARGLGDRFDLLETSMELADLPAGAAAAVLAMGSLQYTNDPRSVVRRFAGWTAPGGVVCVLVDGLLSLVVELTRSGRVEEADERRRSRTGVWRAEGRAADMHLFDADALRATMLDAGLVSVSVRGLLCGWTLLGPDALFEALDRDAVAAMRREAEWSADPTLADLGKQLLAIGRVSGDATA